MAETTERRRLGRGLSALLGDPVLPEPGAQGAAGLTEVAVERIHPNPNQPRRRIEPAALEGLAESIRQHGLVQPVVVRPDARFRQKQQCCRAYLTCSLKCSRDPIRMTSKPSE